MIAGIEKPNAPDAAEQLLHPLADEGIGMRNDIDPHRSGRAYLREGLRNGLQPSVPAFAAMAGDENSKLASVAQTWRREMPHRLARGIHRRIAGNVNFATDLLRAKVGRGQARGREQQGCAGIDRSSELLLGPGEAIVRAQARFHVSDGHARPKAGDRSSQSGGRVPLHDQQVRFTIQCWTQCLNEHGDMFVRVGSPRAVQPAVFEGVQAEITWLKPMLAGQNDQGVGATRSQRASDGLQLDGFGPGADDQTNIGETQPSP